MAYSMLTKISPYEIKVNKKNVFPLKVYDSDFLRSALDSFELAKPVRKSLKQLILDRSFRRAYLYLWWVMFALKFTGRTFGDIDHFNGRDSVTREMKDHNRIELYALMQVDI